MSFPRYEKYKNSGVEWLGEVPEHWEVIAIKHIVSTPITDGPHETPIFLDEGIPFVSAEAMSLGHIDFNKIRGFISEADHLRFSQKYHPQRDDIYMIKSGATTGITAIVETDKEFNIWSPLAAIRCGDKSVPHFVLNFMRSKNFREGVTLNWSFGTQQNIGMGVIQNLAVTVPPIEEQIGIATFLECETVKIDELIAEQQRLIELLKEKRQAVISHAVTKGLNPDVPMKDSGVEWLGVVPKHWEVKQLRHIAKIVRGASPRPAGDPKFFSSDNIDGSNTPWVTVAEITKDDKAYLNDVNEYLTSAGVENSQFFEAGTLIFTNSGATLGVPKILAINCCANDGVLAFKDLAENVDVLFAYHFLSTTTERLRTEMKQGGGQPNLNTDIVKNLSIAVPPLSEQSVIVAFLSNETARFYNLTVEANRAIELLQERRTALISAAVTGKIDVRGFVTAPNERNVVA